MVPVIWAFFSADVNAGTASAARIAIIAITTSNSISVNADISFLIFIVGFLAAVVLRVFGLRGFGFRIVPPWHKAWAERVFWGFGFRLLFGSSSGGFGLRLVGAYRSLHRESQIIIFYFFGGYR